MKLIIGIFLILFSIHVAAESEQINLILPNGRIDANTVIKGLPLHSGTSKSTDKTNRFLKHWSVSGKEDFEANLEITGYNFTDADFISFKCAEFDAKFQVIWPWPENSACAKISRILISNIVDKPDKVLSPLIDRTTSNSTAIKLNNIDISINNSVIFIHNLNNY